MNTKACLESLLVKLNGEICELRAAVSESVLVLQDLEAAKKLILDKLASQQEASQAN